MKKNNLLIFVCLALGAHTLSYTMDTSTDTKKRKPEREHETWYCAYPECDKTFTERNHLLHHEKKHTNTCTECGKFFPKKGDLERHTRTHTGERPFKCTQCGKDFGDNSHRLKHERIHANEKPFKCDECGRTFANKDSLNKHSNIHTGYTFKCKYCSKKYASKGTRKTHMQKKHAAILIAACKSSRKASSSKPAPAEIPALPIPTADKPTERGSNSLDTILSEEPYAGLYIPAESED